jgi:hypothetical protein
MVGAASERLDLLQRVVAPGALPVRSQRVLVNSRPLGDEPHGSGWKLAGDHVHGLDVDRGLIVGVRRVEMRFGPGGGWPAVLAFGGYASFTTGRRRPVTVAGALVVLVCLSLRQAALPEFYV